MALLTLPRKGKSFEAQLVKSNAPSLRNIQGLAPGRAGGVSFGEFEQNSLYCHALCEEEGQLPAMFPSCKICLLLHIFGRS